jgi:hypothetical protein
MSNDLFAAFGGGSASQPSTNDDTLSLHDNTLQQTWISRPEPEEFPSQPIVPTGIQDQQQDDDDFGDFEDASASIEPRAEPQPHVSQPPVAQPDDPPVPAKQIRKKQSFPPKAAPKPAQAEPKKQSTGRHPFAGHMDLLFEAGDDEYDAGTDELADLSNNPEAAMAYSKRIIAEQEAAQERSRTVSSKPTRPQPKKDAETKPTPNKLRKKSGYAPTARNAEVLFDAENVSEHDDDDFGGFEDWEQPAVPKKVSSSKFPAKNNSLPAVDLLGLDDPPSQHDKSTSFQHTAPKPPKPQQTLENSSQPSAQRPASVAPADAEDDVWDDFETAAPSTSAVDDSWDDFETSAPTRSSTTPSSNNTLASPSPQPPLSMDTLPPTNIPPPILLLSLFPSLFSAADDALFDTMSKLDLKQRQTLLAHPATHQFLRGYLDQCVVLAHIIAGRKMRWKRDQRLSQSMRIGPAAAGGKGGMKLAGLDKSELAKEDREVEDVLQLWKGQVGKLRTAVTSASATPGLPKLPSVPDITEQMPVKALKQGEGGVTAPHACALCGLKREERVAKVDVEVEDSFGEWWVNGMDMHVVCKNFWQDNERKLKSR